jgi:hypothetical protein
MKNTTTIVIGNKITPAPNKLFRIKRDCLWQRPKLVTLYVKGWGKQFITVEWFITFIHREQERFNRGRDWRYTGKVTRHRSAMRERLRPEHLGQTFYATAAEAWKAHRKMIARLRKNDRRRKAKAKLVA